MIDATFFGRRSDKFGLLVAKDTRSMKPVGYRFIQTETPKEAAEEALDRLEEKWGQKYPIVLQSWRNHWENLSYCFQFSQEIRKIIYTTNIIESVHRQFRKLTKIKGAFPNEESLLKLLYLGIQNAQKRLTRPIANWGITVSQLVIHYPRLEGYLDL